jgi:hypothetical protein
VANSEYAQDYINTTWIQRHMEPSTISHPHKDYLFLVIEESGVELRDDFLIPVVPKLE